MTDTMAKEKDTTPTDAQPGRDRKLRQLVGALEEAKLCRTDQTALLTEARAARMKIVPRLDEVAQVSRRLEDVAAQASVAALNVSVEVSRGESASEETLATLAEEVRRMADRTAKATRRMSELIRELEEASQTIDARLELAIAAHDGCAREQRRALDRADELVAQEQTIDNLTPSADPTGATGYP